MEELQLLLVRLDVEVGVNVLGFKELIYLKIMT